MVLQKEEFPLVDLHTTSRKLEDLMLSDYPGRIFPDKQHIVHEDSDSNYDIDDKLYSFLDLSREELLEYLTKIDKKIKDGWYYVRNSRTGTCLRTRSRCGEVEDYS